ncbi:MAG: hypothetical protein J4431_03860 [Candidatus Aenigmarchaeota archaeon]|nr:hypothetical protein [Candidatus Aenigmarchaeota archaeon]
MVSIILREIPKQIEDSHMLPDIITDQPRFMSTPPWEAPKSYIFSDVSFEPYPIGGPAYMAGNVLGRVVYIPSHPKSYKLDSLHNRFAGAEIYIPGMPEGEGYVIGGIKPSPAAQIGNFNDIYLPPVQKGEGFLAEEDFRDLGTPAWLNFPSIYSADNAVQKYLDDAAATVKNEDRLGLRSHQTGSITVYPKENDAALGVTGIRMGPKGAYADSLEINEDILNGAITNPEVYLDELYRVAKHELRHVDSAELAGYADVPEDISRMVMEGYAEYRGMINGKNVPEALSIFRTSPYKPEILAAAEIDHAYVGLDGKNTGYRAFINDIVEQKSMRAGLAQFARSIKFHQN